MKHINVVLFLIFIFFYSKNSSSAERENHLLSLINTEIATIEKVAKKGEQLNYRLFELYIEKTKMLRRSENELMIKDQTAGKKVDKQKYFLNSEKSFQMTQDFGLSMIKKFPKSRYLAAFYYGLASHQIEIQNNIERDQNIIINWLTLALNKATNAEKEYLAQVKLAEVYYTLKDYQKAIKNYLVVIKNNDDKWYTKNLYNLSWCFFQTKEYDKSVSLALKAFHVSSKKGYEDVRFVAMDALDYFYVFLKKPEKGIQFHIKYNKNALSRMEHIVKLINLSKKFISSEVALQTEKPARNFCKSISDYVCLLNLSALKLDIYRENKNFEQHYSLVKDALTEYKFIKLKKLDFDQEILSNIINNIGETASTYQQLVYKSYYVFNNSAEETYKNIIEYYQALKEFNPPFHYEYAYLQGELSFKETKYDNAGKFYFESFEKIKNNKSITNEFVEKLFKSMLALANDPQYSNKEYFEKAHLAYLDYYDKKPNAIPIYEALFKFYQTEKRWSFSENLLVRFHDHMPNEITIQREMTKVVLNNFTEQKDIQKLNYWIGKLKQGFLSFEKVFIEQNIKILAQLLFEGAQAKENKKEYAAAISEYEKIVNNKEYPNEVRADSMYNISVDYLRLKDASQSYSWLKDSIRLKTQEAILKKVADIEAIAHEYVLIQAMPEASALYKYLLKNQCSALKQVDSTLLVYAQLEIAQNRSDIFNDLLKISPCKFKDDSLAFARNIYIDLLWQQKSFLKLGNLAKNIQFKAHWSDIFHNFYSSFWRYSDEDKNNSEYILLTEQLAKFYNITKDSLSNQAQLEYTAINDWSKEDANLTAFTQKVFSRNTEKGNLKVLQKNLEAELTDLSTLKDEKLKLISSLKDSNLSQAQLFSLILRFQKAKDWFITWQCNSKNKDEKNQWFEVQKQVVSGLDEQIASFKEAISDAINRGALPLANIQNVRGDKKFDSHFYQNKNEDLYFIMHRIASNTNGGAQ